MSASLRLFLALLCIVPSAWAQNSAPIGTQDLYAVEANEMLSVPAESGLFSNDYDPDGDSFFLSSGILPDHGELTFLSGGSFTYTPDTDFVGTDTFGYRISDGSLTTDLITVTIEVLPSPNRAPTAVTDGYTTPFETELSVPEASGLLVNDYDPDGDQLFVGAFTSPANGSVSVNISTGAITYTPNSGFTGVDRFQYRIRDPDFASSSLVDVFIDVQAPTNRAPQAFDNYYATPANTSLSVPAAAGLLFNDYDPDGNTIFVGAFTDPPNGSVSIDISTGALTYTPNSGFTGVDSFQYRSRDPDFAISSLVDVFIGVGVDALLPVELTSFEALVDGNNVHLRWETASETNNAGFEVERAVDGAAFASLDFVEGHGTAAEPHAYTFTDTRLPAEVHNLTYRLKQVDFDGTVDYSPEVEVAIDMTDAFRLTAPYPNPARTQTRFSLAVRRAQRVEVVLYDMLGRRVQTLFADALPAQAARALVLDAAGLPSGSYVVRAEGETFVATQRFVLAR